MIKQLTFFLWLLFSLVFSAQASTFECGNFVNTSTGSLIVADLHNCKINNIKRNSNVPSFVSDITTGDIVNEGGTNIVCKANQTRNMASGACTYTASGTEFDPTTSSGTLTNNYDNTSSLAGSVFPKGTTTVTWTQSSGTTRTCTMTITIIDNVSPSITCVGNQTRNINSGSCSYTATGTEFNPTSSTDNCTGSVLSNNYRTGTSLTGAVFPKGTTTVIWTVTDGSARTTTCSFTITVNDNISPSITCPGNQTRSTGSAICTYTATGTEFDPLSSTDNCTGSTISNNYRTGTSLAGATFPKGSTTVIWTVTDGSARTTTCSFTITINDNISPSITCPGNQTRNTGSANCTYTATGTEFDPLSSTDNCTGSTISNNYRTGTSLAGAIFPKGSTTVIWTVTDGSARTTTCSFTITINDNISPSITCPGNQTRSTGSANCTYTATGTEFDPLSSTDNCTGATISNNYRTGTSLAGATFPKGSTTVIWTVTDASARTTTCSFTITVNDNITPAITCIGNQTRSASGSCNYTATGSEFDATFSDNCTGAVLSNNFRTGTSLAGATFPKGTTTLVWTVTDAGGRTSTCSHTITVRDNQAPAIACAGNQVRSVSSGNCSYTATGTEFNPASSSDNCTGSTVSNSYGTGTSLTGASFPIGVTTLVWTATDGSGNTTTCSFTVTVEDHLSPTITCGGNKTRSATTGTCTYTTTGSEFDPLNFSDNCTGSTISNNYRTGSSLAGASFPKGTTTVIWTVTDVSGNTTTCSSTVTVNDTQAPTITCGASGSRPTNSGQCTYTVAGNEFDPSSVSDNCGATTISNNFGTGSSLSGAVLSKGSHTIVWTVTDGSGNSATCSNTITVSDNQNPTITCASAISVNSDNGICTYASSQLTAPNAGDNCSVASVVASPSSLNLGNNTVTWTATDGSGNTATCTQAVTVIDDQDPLLTAPWSKTVSSDEGTCNYASSQLTPPNATDNCHVQSLTPSITNLDLGLNIVVWTVTDGSGNTATATQQVTVIDDQDPLLTAPWSKTVSSDEGTCNYTSSQLTPPNATDNCHVQSLTPSITNLDLGLNIVVWTVTDGSGNTATATQQVTVIDDQDPTITCGASKTVPADNGSCTYAGSQLTPPDAADNCHVGSVTASITTLELGLNVVVWTVTDGSGNTATCTQAVTVIDDQDPTITCGASKTVPADNGSCTYAGSQLTPPDAADNCHVGSVTASITTLELGLNIVVWTVTDGSGNTATCTQAVTVIDDQNPTITCGTSKTVSADNGTCNYAGSQLTPPDAADNCHVGSVTASIATLELGLNIVVWTVTDGSGNTATCTQAVTVIDDQNPTITCGTSKTVSADNGTCTYAGSQLTPPDAADNCHVENVTASIATLELGLNIVVWTVTDGSGNIATCTQAVTVIDDQNPTITCGTSKTVSADNGTCTYAGSQLTPPDAADNCHVESVTASITTLELGLNIVVWTVTDGSGNTATCTQAVTVIDDQNPTITCGTSKTVSADNGTCTYAGSQLTPPDAADNCHVESVTSSIATLELGLNIVVWTVTDGSGNTATCTQAVTVIDDQNPTITCGTSKTVSADNGTCTYAGSQLTPPDAADNCHVESVTSSIATLELGLNIVVWTVTDGSGNTATCTQAVTVIDDQNPTITCGTSKTVSADNGTCTYAGSQLTPPDAADNCHVESVTASIATLELGLNIVVWTVTDGSGNTATCTQAVTVIDDQNPTITCGTSKTVSADNGTCTYAGSQLTPPDAADNCHVESVTASIATLELGLNIVVWTVTDGSGNTATCTQAVTVIDDQNPTITCGTSKTVSADNGTCTYAGSQLTPPDAADNCHVESVTASIATLELGLNIVVWTVTDGSGNTATCTQAVTVIDDQNPTITCGTSKTVSADNGTCTYAGSQLTPPDAADNCHVESVTASIATLELGLNIVVWTVTDGSGNTATCTQAVTVIDDQNPTITCGTSKTVSADNGTCTYAGSQLTPPDAADNCHVESVTASIATLELGLNIVVWTVTDGSGNTATCTQAVTVIDDQDPTITCGASKTVSADNGSCTYAGSQLTPPDAADNCHVESVTASITTLELGLNIVVWTVTDGSGNTATCTQAVTVIDDQDPTITCGASKTVPADNGSCTYASSQLTPPDAADNCHVQSVTPSITTLELGLNIVVWTVTDGSGNTATCTQAVTVIDDQDPTITCGASKTVPADNGSCTYASSQLTPPDAADNCHVGSVTASITTLELGLNTVVWTVTDGSGNTATCTQNITVIDDQNPSITSIGSASRATDAGSCNYLVIGDELDPSSATDNCTSVTITNDYNTGSTLGGEELSQGTHTIIWTVTDGSGNTSTTSSVITVSDTESPTITCLGSTTKEADGSSTYVVSGIEFDPEFNDNCSATIINDYNSSATLDNEALPIGTHTILWTVSDGAGNTATCSTVITVNDATPPSITCVGSQSKATDNGKCSYKVVGSEFDPEFTHNNNAAISNDYNSGSSLADAELDKGSHDILWTVTDHNGNSATCSITILVKDMEAPTITCAGNQTRSINSGNCSYVASGIEFDPAFGDNCTGITISNNYTTCTSLTGKNFPVGTTTVVWTVTDACSNSTTCSMSITVIDNQLPTITCVANQTRTTAGSCGYTVSGTEFDPAFAGSCAGVSISNNYQSGSSLVGQTLPIGITNVVWMVTDASSRTSTCSFSVTVQSPEINVQGNSVDIVDGDITPSNTDYTDYGSGTVVYSRVFTIQNTGTSALSISSISLSGGNAADFSISGAPSSVPAGSSATFTVNFEPLAVGMRSTTVHIANGDCNEADYDFAIQGAPGFLIPYIGTYSDLTMIEGTNATITPSGTTRNLISATANTTTNFTGTLFVNPTTGLVTLTDAKQAGNYVVTVKGYNETRFASTTFTLTVLKPNCSLGTLTSTSDVSVANSPFYMAIGDFNNDGKQDIAVANSISTSVSIRLGNGSGGFTGTTDISVGGQPYGIAVADFNGDGKMDIITANSIDVGTASIRLGDGAGGFSGTTEVGVGSRPRAVAVADFNGDTKMDLAVANYNSNDVSIRLGDGNGGFTGTTTIALGSGTNPYSIIVGDFNGDGKRDFATANFTNGRVSIKLGDGAGNFSGSTVVTVGTNPMGLSLGDFNNDGKQDIAVANSNSANLAILKGNGNGTFTVTVLSVPATPYNIAVGDYNGDGVQDLAVAHASTAGKVTLCFGNFTTPGVGLGTFSGLTSYSTGANTRCVAIGDINGDGKEDVLGMNANSYTVSVLLNNTSCGLGKRGTYTAVDPEPTKENVEFNVYPNPTSGAFKVDVNSTIESPLKITVFNYLGQEVQTIFEPDFIGSKSVNVDLHDLASTYYIVKVETAGQILYRKVMLSKE